MIDFIYSKLGLVVAALIITSSIFAVYQWQTRETDTLSMKKIAENTAEMVNQVTTSKGETRQLVTFDSSQKHKGMYFPSTVSGEKYTLRIDRSQIILSQEGKSVSADFGSSVHVWNPGEMENVSGAELERADEEIDLLKFKSAYDYYIESTHLNGSGYECFIYLEKSEEFQKNVVDPLGQEINEFYKIKDVDNIDKSKTMSADKDFIVYPNVIVFNKTDERNYRSCYIVDVDHLWDPDEISQPIEKDEMDAKDENNVFLDVDGSFTLERKEIKINNGTEIKRVVQGFIY